MYTKDLKNTKGIALIYLIMIILSILIISAVAIVGVTKKVRKGGTNQEISQGTSKTAETQQKDITSNNKDTKVTAKQIAKNPEKYYGQEVKNYTKGDRVYRIFYVDTEGYFGDKNTIYLKADWVVNEVSLDEKGADYTPKTTKVLEKMNQQWAKERLNANWYENEHCAAWLCDPSTKDPSSNREWISYFDENKANYVIGSPSVEMFVKSYNQVPHEIGDKSLGAKYSEEDFPGYIYKLNGVKSAVSNDDYSTGRETVDYKGYNKMYCVGDEANGGIWAWMASPSSSDKFSLCMVSMKVSRFVFSIFYFSLFLDIPNSFTKI